MMHLPAHIHITGGSGSGTTTLGRVLAARHGHRHLDTDDFFWEPTDPPFTVIRAPSERLRLLEVELDHLARPGGGRLADADRWVISGSLDRWGNPVVPRFDLVVWLTVPEDVRVARLRSRERTEFGPRIDPGGDMEEIHEGFIEWSRKYDTAGPEMRSHARHVEWTAQLPCPFVRIDGEVSVESTLARVEEFWARR